MISTWPIYYLHSPQLAPTTFLKDHPKSPFFPARNFILLTCKMAVKGRWQGRLN